MRGTRNNQRKLTTSPVARSVWRCGWLGAATILCAVSGVAGLFGYFTDVNHVPIHKIQVSGVLKHLQRETVEAVVAGSIDGNFFTVDMARIRDHVRALPWVDQVSMRRRWPGTLVMQVTEQVPIARWGDDRLVNARGEIFAPDGAAIASDLVRLGGPEGSASRVIAFHRTAATALQGVGLTIRRLQLNERREWWLEVDRGMTLVLGRHEAWGRLRRFGRVYPLLAADTGRRPVRVDLRYAQGLAVTWAAQSVDAERYGKRRAKNTASNT